MSEYEGSYQAVVKKNFTTELVTKVLKNSELCTPVRKGASKVSKI